MNKLTAYFGILLVGITCLTSSCKTEPDEEPNNFDRSALLTRTADSIIVPQYAELNVLAYNFQIAVNSFTSSPSTGTLDAAKTAWINLYTQWENCKMFDFGPAMEEGLLRRLNSFPSDSVKIESNISNANYDLDLSDQTYSQGLPAFDYLFYHLDENDIVAEMDANRSTYLNDLALIIQTKINNTSVNWATYRDQFIASNGTDASSSTSLLVNEMNKDFERIKNLKFGFPLGVNVLQIAQPKYIETRYSKNDFLLAKENTQAIKNLYQGISKDGIDGLGFDDYLASFGDNGTTIKTNTLNDFNTLIMYYDNYQNEMEVELSTNYNQVYTHYEHYANMVYHLKSELPSTISILITYNDNDGD